jgi:hypothetical protein
MKKDKRIEVIQKRAREYANSGLYSGWQNIEWKLRQEGLFEARDELDDPETRSEIDELCRKARSPLEVENRSKNLQNGDEPA